MKSDPSQFKPDFKGQSWEEQQNGVVTQEASDAKTKAYRERPYTPTYGFGSGVNSD
jgi:hypothetical protein